MIHTKNKNPKLKTKAKINLSAFSDRMQNGAFKPPTKIDTLRCFMQEPTLKKNWCILAYTRRTKVLSYQQATFLISLKKNLSEVLAHNLSPSSEKLSTQSKKFFIKKHA